MLYLEDLESFGNESANHSWFSLSPNYWFIRQARHLRVIGGSFRLFVTANNLSPFSLSYQFFLVDSVGSLVVLQLSSCRNVEVSEDVMPLCGERDRATWVLRVSCTYSVFQRSTELFSYFHKPSNVWSVSHHPRKTPIVSSIETRSSKVVKSWSMKVLITTRKWIAW